MMKLLIAFGMCAVLGGRRAGRRLKAVEHRVDLTTAGTPNIVAWQGNITIPVLGGTVSGFRFAYDPNLRPRCLVNGLPDDDVGVVTNQRHIYPGSRFNTELRIALLQRATVMVGRRICFHLRLKRDRRAQPGPRPSGDAFVFHGSSCPRARERCIFLPLHQRVSTSEGDISPSGQVEKPVPVRVRPCQSDNPPAPSPPNITGAFVLNKGFVCRRPPSALTSRPATRHHKGTTVPRPATPPSTRPTA